MHAFVYAFLIFLLRSPGATAKPIAMEDDLFADYSLFTADDSELMGTGEDLDLFVPSDNLLDLSAAGSACPSEVSLLDDYDSSLDLDPSNDLFVRDLDDNLLAGKKPATCANPGSRPSNSDKKLQLPQFEMLMPIDGSTSSGRCNTYGQSVQACCDYTAGTSPLNCQAWPFYDCSKRWEYCCRDILPDSTGNNCELLEGPLERMIHDAGLPATWDEMEITGDINHPSGWINPWTRARQGNPPNSNP